jgi:thiazolinyl reductase component of yersiniabactin synthetase
MKRRRRIAVCGTVFGQAWIDVISRHRRRYQLVAVVARGSRHSKDVCRRYGIPMATSVSAVNAPVDAAVVAVGGGAGEEIAFEWLRRGVPVLMEHPVGPSFVERAQRGFGSRTRLHINGHFCDLPAATRFIRICRAAAKGHEAYAAVIIATPRTLYSCLDIAVALLPPRELARIRFRRPGLNSLGEPEFRLGPLRLSVKLMCSTSDADDSAGSLGGHFIQLWLPDRRITLVSPTGPIITLGTEKLREATWSHDGASKGPSWERYDLVERPAALIAALDRLVGVHPSPPSRKDLQGPLLVSRIWENVIRPRGF